MPPELWYIILSYVPPSSHLAVSLTCTCFRDIIKKIYYLALRNGHTCSLKTDFGISCSYSLSYFKWLLSEHDYITEYMPFLGRYCVRHNNMECVWFMLQHYNVKPTEDMCLEAIKSGHIDAFDKMYPYANCATENILTVAATFDRVGIFERFYKYPPGLKLILTIVTHGSPAMLQIAWDKRGVFYTNSLTKIAAKNNNTETLHWLIARNIRIDSSVSAYGIMHDNQAMFHIGMCCAVWAEEITMTAAVQSANSAYLEYLIDSGWEVKPLYLHSAVNARRTQNVKLLLQHTSMPSSLSFQGAAADECIDMLGWFKPLIDNNVLVKQSIFHGDNVGLLQQFKITLDAVHVIGLNCTHAGRINMIKYLCTHYTVDCPRAWFECAITHGQYRIVRYLHAFYQFAITQRDIGRCSVKQTVHLPTRPLFIKTKEYLLHNGQAHPSKARNRCSIQQ